MRISYPSDLPISTRRDDIAAAIRDNQVVVLAGETGSGKTTQLPKICLELGRGKGGSAGRIGHTQPRRLAARTVATRIASELETELGDVVGWKVRFTDQVSERTRVKLMTDGILLAELTGDRMLRQYDTLIIDEAHERSLNIDFILGYLKRLLPKRPDLKLIITSATIDPERFAEHFGTPGKPAPIIEVSGRMYPVEQRYRPVVDPDDPKAEERDLAEAIVDSVRELTGEGPGDVLVFLPGERDIRDAADALGDAMRRGALADSEILPLFARLSTAEQQQVFAPHTNRRIVLATNVAETSLTVPGIKYVVDPGLARISRYSHRTKVQRLPIEKISQASANQRAGRCGRTSDGICIRLYAEDDFDARPEFTDPEILRTNLASVVLRMIALGFGEVADFPFLDPPDRRAVTDGVNLLHELGALDGTDNTRRITETGKALERLPIEPRFARMLIEAGRNGCAAEMLVIVSGLSIQDPRERPSDNPDPADQSHARFADPRSDFVSLLNLWRYLGDRRAELTGNQFRKMCRTEYLHYLRIREWQDLHGQLRRVLRDLDITPNVEPADHKVVHQSLLAGLLSHIGLQIENTSAQDPTRRRRPDRNAYLGARSASFAIFPGSTMFRRPPRWVMAAELVETSRLWARTVARIEPEWIEPLATHLVRSTYSEPHWSAKRGAVMAHERVTLYGIPIVADRLVNYAGVDPELARELFIRHALVGGEWHPSHAFWKHNQELLEQVDEWEQRARRRDIMVDEQALFDFYAARIPASVVSARHFDRWWSRTLRDTPDLLDLSLSDLTSSDGVSESEYPSVWTTSTPGASEPARLSLRYEFEPGKPTDGVSVDVPLVMLNQVDEGDFDWQIPGHREELLTTLIRGLRKDLRRNFVPVPDTVRTALVHMDPARGSMLDELTRVLREMHGVTVPRESWRLDRVPEHLRITFRVLDAGGGVLATGKDLGALRQRLAGRTRQAVAAAAPELERSGLTAWAPLTTLPHQVRRSVGGHSVTGYPALVDAGASVDVRVLSTPAEQRAAMWAGTRRLLLLNVQPPVRQVRRTLGPREHLVLSQGPHGSEDALFEDCLSSAADAVLASAGGPAWDAAGFGALLASASAHLTGALVDVVAAVVEVLHAATDVRSRLASLTSPVVASSVADVRAQLASLVYPGFVTGAGASRLADVTRYLRAASRRLETLPQQLTRDQDWMARVHEVQGAYQELLSSLPGSAPVPDAVAEIRWMIEELRVSFFAQSLGTRYSVSEKRVYRAIDDLLP